MNIEKAQMGKDDFELYDDKPWFKIDNAATLYAAARTKNWTRTFRTTLVLDEDIDPLILQKALDDISKRFPFFCVQLRDGFFWSYFERIDEIPKIVPDSNYPYRPIDLGDNKKPCFVSFTEKTESFLKAFIR